MTKRSLLAMLTYWCLLTLCIAGQTPEATAQTIPPLPVDYPTYGAPALVAEARESCATEATLAPTIILTPDQDWEAILTDEVNEVQNFLLRGGIYRASDKLQLPPGLPGTPRLIKPYNCERVTIYGSLEPTSHTIIAGLHLEATERNNEKWTIRMNGDEETLTDIVLRHNRITGGSIDAIRINDAVTDVIIKENHIDGGRNGHNLFVTGSVIPSITVTSTFSSAIPNNITITGNLLTKRHFATASEDMLQVRNVGLITVTHNTCANGSNMEQCIDIKRTTTPLLIAHNLFDGDTLHHTGQGEDGSGGCMVIHEEDTVADPHRIEHNFFRHCQRTVIRFATGGDEIVGSAHFRYNLLIQTAGAIQIVPVEAATNLLFEYNTMLYGTLKLGRGDQARSPTGLVLANNIFYRTEIEDHLSSSGQPYQCHHNLFYQQTGSKFEVSSCTASIEADPAFADLTLQNLYLRADSPAIGAGENDTLLGALPIDTGQFVRHQLFLPMIWRE